MNSVASFLPNPPARPVAASQGTRGDSESLKDGHSKGEGFDAVLSGLSTNSSSEEPSASPTAPVRSSLPGAGSGRSEEAQVPSSQASSAGGSLVLSRLAARGGPLAADSLTTDALAATSLAAGSLAGGSLPTIAGTKASAAQIGQANNSSPIAPAAASGSVQPKTGVPPANIATTGPANTPSSKDLTATTSLVAAETSASARPVTVTVAADGDKNGSGVPAAVKADVSSGSRDASANASAAISSAATVIAATLQGVLPVAQSIEPRPSKTSRTDLNGRSTSTATSKSTDKKSSETAAPTTGIIDPAVQAAMAATIPAVSTSQAVKPNGTQSQGPAAPQIDVRIQGAADSNAVVGAGQNEAGTISPDSFAGSVEMTVTTISSATHFAPVARLSPAQQIADAVIGAVPDLSQGLAGSTASSLTDATEPEGSAFPAVSFDPAASADSGPVKTLNLELEPASLGTVTITLNLSAGGLDVRLAASQSSTMNLINKDKDSLSDQLRQSGYSLAGVAVTLSGQDESSVANNGSATQDPGGQAASQGGGGQAMSYGGSSNGNGTSQNNGRNESGRAAPAQAPLGVAPNSEMAIASRRVAGGDLYL